MTARTPAELLHAIRNDGYVVIERLIDDAAVSRLRDALDPWLQGQHMGRNDFEGLRSERVYALLAKSPAFSEIIEHPLILELLDDLLPKNYLLSAALAIKLHPGETCQGWHRDDGGDFMGWPREWLGISTIWALDDFTEDNGATEVIPGSHRWEADRQPEPGEAVTVTMPAGSVVVFAGNLLHRGGANRSRGFRLAITPQYCAPFMRQLESMLLAIPPETAATLSPRVQSLLGYSVMDPGFKGYVDGMHPRRLLDAGYVGRKYRADLPPS